MNLKPTINCNQLGLDDIGHEVVLAGWVSSWRDHGGVVFIDLRDINGVTQLVFLQEPDPVSLSLLEKAHKLRNEYVIAVSGSVRKRPEESVNPKIKTGSVEVVVNDLELLNSCRELPFDLKGLESVGEESRLKYRYLEMRAGSLKENLIFKHKLFQLTRNYFSENDFIEIETPMLTRSTPEGARDFLVPSRINPGHFYALPQSPQLFKQMLMVGGFMRYFQIVKCFRDEDLRQDRQPEFTQLDLEMSFVDVADVKKVLEGYIALVFKKLLDIDIKTPFRTMSYHESMRRYGSDKPDLRNPIEIVDICDIASNCSFKVFSKATVSGMVRGIKLENEEYFSLSVIDKLTDELKPLGAKGLAWMKVKDGRLNSQICKFFSEEELSSIKERFAASDGDILFFIADNEDTVSKSLSYLRTKFFEPDSRRYEFLWIEDYPLFEMTDDGKWTPIHHPFTSPHPEDTDKIEKDPGNIRSLAYDMVLNGSEIGGGSIRVHSIELQNRIFKVLEMTEKEIEDKFGFLLKALSYGAPPHGGFAFGLDRLVTRMLNLASIREAIPFPKTQKGYSPLTDAPSLVDNDQLEELFIKVDKAVIERRSEDE